MSTTNTMGLPHLLLLASLRKHKHAKKDCKVIPAVISLSASHFIAACRMCCFVWIRRDYKLFCKQCPQTICQADIDGCVPSNHDHIPTNIICFELQKPAIKLGLSKDDLIIKCAFYLLVFYNFDININEI